MTDSFAQSRVKWFMRHTYTWQQRLPAVTTPPVDDVDDAWGTSDPQYAAPVSGKPCIYHDIGTELADPQGVTVNVRPVIRVPWDDPIADTDLVTDIRDSSGNVLSPGPMRVLVGTEHAPHGPLLYRVLPLISTTVED